MNIPEGVLIALVGVVGTFAIWIGKALMNRADNSTRLVEQVLRQQTETNQAVIDPSSPRSPGGSASMTLAQQVGIISEVVSEHGVKLDKIERKLNTL